MRTALLPINCAESIRISASRDGATDFRNKSLADIFFLVPMEFTTEEVINAELGKSGLACFMV